ETLSERMAFLVIIVHEMFHPCFSVWARHAAHAQVEHEAGIVRGEAAEFGGGHAGAAQEGLDFADQHGGSLSAVSGCGSIRPAGSDARSRNPTCLGKILRIGRRAMSFAGNSP